MGKTLKNIILFYLLLAVFFQPVVTINYFLLGLLGFIYLTATLLFSSRFLPAPSRGLFAACYIVPFYLIQQTMHVPGYGWMVIHNVLIIAMVLLVWQDESFLSPPYLSEEAPYRQLDLAVPLTVFFYVASLIIVPALGPKLVNWNSVQRSSLVVFEALFFYFVITRCFTEEKSLKRLNLYLVIAYLAISAWGGVNVFNTYQSMSRTNFYLQHDQTKEFVESWQKTYDYNQITNIKKIQKKLEKLAQ